MTPAPSKAIAKRDYNRPATSSAGLLELGKPLLPQIAAALPRMLAGSEERFLRTLLTECSRTPRLMDCTPISLFAGLIQAAQLGLELGGPAGQCWLIPFKNQAQLIPGYKGYISLAHRSDRVRRITPRIHHANDVFDMDEGDDARIVHKRNLTDPGKPVGYYTIIELTNGGKDHEYMTSKECEVHRDLYAMDQRKGKDGNYLGIAYTDFDAWALKTTIRKLAKRIPVSIEWNRAAGLEEQADLGIPQANESLVVLEGEASTDRADELKDRLDKAKKGKPVAASTQGSGPAGEYVPGVDEPREEEVPA